MNQIRIPTSKLANCIGLNQYQSIEDAVFELINCRGMNTLEKLQLKDQLSDKSKTELCSALGLEANSNLLDINKALQSDCYKTAKTNGDNSALLSKLTDTTLQAAIGGEYNKMGGIVHEKKDLDTLAKKEGVTITKRTTVMNHMIINLDEVSELKLTGKIDGYCPEKDCIIETKHRKNRLFRTVPEYERVQCEVYMRMFGVSRVYHTETFGDNSIETLLEKDDPFWNKILMLLKTKFLPLYYEYSKI